MDIRTKKAYEVLSKFIDKEAKKKFKGVKNEKREILLEVIDRITIDVNRKSARVYGYLPLSEHKTTQDLVNEPISRDSGITKCGQVNVV